MWTCVFKWNRYEWPTFVWLSVFSQRSITGNDHRFETCQVRWIWYELFISGVNSFLLVRCFWVELLSRCNQVIKTQISSRNIWSWMDHTFETFVGRMCYELMISSETRLDWPSSLWLSDISYTTRLGNDHRLETWQMLGI